MTHFIEYIPKTGVNYVKVNRIDCILFGGFAICDLCGKDFINGYLVYLLNSCLCENCFYSSSIHKNKYPDDLELQNKFSKKYYKEHLLYDLRSDD